MKSRDLQTSYFPNTLIAPAEGFLLLRFFEIVLAAFLINVTRFEQQIAVFAVVLAQTDSFFQLKRGQFAPNCASSLSHFLNPWEKMT